MIDYLLLNWIDVNQINKMKTNCLQIAIEVNDIKVIELLKLRGGVLPSLPPIVKKKRKKTRRPTSTIGVVKVI